MFKSIIIPALAGIAVLAAPATALAGEAKSNTVLVEIGDLDLTSEAGISEMQKRVRSASYKACLTDEKGKLVSHEEQFACTRVAQEKTETQMAQKIANSRYGG